MDFLALVQQLLSSPNGPHTPFSSTSLAIVDTIRIIVLVLGVLTLAVSPFAMAKARLPGQQVRLLVLALFTFSAIATEITHVGDYASWRLIVNTLAVAGAIWGQWSFFKFELPTQIKLQPDPLHLRVQIPPDADDTERTDHEAQSG